jgi:hypothetical protein
MAARPAPFDASFDSSGSCLPYPAPRDTYPGAFHLAPSCVSCVGGLIAYFSSFLSSTCAVFPLLNLSSARPSHIAPSLYDRTGSDRGLEAVPHYSYTTPSAGRVPLHLILPLFQVKPLSAPNTFDGLFVCLFSDQLPPAHLPCDVESGTLGRRLFDDTVAILRKPHHPDSHGSAFAAACLTD